MDILKVSSGSFLWNGQPGSSNAMRRQIGTLLETPNFYHYLSGRKNLEIAAAIKQRGKEDIPRVFGKSEPHSKKRLQVQHLFHWYETEAGDASTCLVDPDILVLMNLPMDWIPAGIAEIRELIKQTQQPGKDDHHG